MVTLVADQKKRVMQRQLLFNMTAECLPGGIDDIDHHPPVRPVSPVSAEQPGSLFFCFRGPQDRLLPLIRQRNRRHHDPETKLRIKGSQTFPGLQRQYRFSSPGHDIHDPAPSVFLPGRKTSFLPLIQFHLLHTFFRTIYYHLYIFILFLIMG